MNILGIIKEACKRLTLSVPSVATTSTDTNVVSLLALLGEEAAELQERHDWRALMREQTFTTTAADVQANAIPSDFLRFVPETIWNRTKTWRVVGPITPDEWQAHKASNVTRVGDSFRIRGTDMLFAPTPPAGETIAFEYITTMIGRDAGGALIDAYGADSDTPLLDAELIIRGLVFRFRQSKGLDYAEAQIKYERRLAKLLSADGGSRRISMDGGSENFRPLAPRVPETLVFS